MGRQSGVSSRKSATFRFTIERGLYWGRMDLGLPNPRIMSGTFGSGKRRYAGKRLHVFTRVTTVAAVNYSTESNGKLSSK